MQLIEKKMNLFEVDDKYYLAHCISSDFEMGAGIAVEFNKRFSMRARLRTRFGYKTDFPKAVLVDKVFNLITKNKYCDKPTYQTIEKTIVEMKEMCIDKNIKYLAIPKIGCGLDKLSWGKVREIIKEVFTDTDIEILVCSL